MQREIKFRVWDKDQKRMFMPTESIRPENPDDFNYPTLIQEFDVSFAGLEDSYRSFPAKYFFSENYVCQEFTGLRDENNKDIYEGDIVCGTLDLREVDELGRQYTGDLFTFKGEVIYEAPSFICQNADFPLDSYESLKIIGNIYENPELLT